MTSSFAQMKNSRKQQLEKLSSSLKSNAPQESSGGDDRFWKPEVDKTGNGFAIIRFLPVPANEDVPYIRFWDHGFQGPGGWYIEKSLTSINQKDPVSEYNAQLWATGLDENKEIVRKQKRRLHYISNILVIKDPAHPENEGKVFLFQYGKKIYEKIAEKIEPQFEDETPVNVFDMWEGANFKIKIRQVDGYRNYDKSEFDNPSAISDDDDELETIWKKQHSLKQFVEPAQYKSYQDLKNRLHKVLGWNDSSFEEKAPVAKSAEEMFAPKQKEVKPKVVESDDSPFGSEDDEEGLDFFKKMVEED